MYDRGEKANYIAEPEFGTMGIRNNDRTDMIGLMICWFRYKTNLP
jgi:hypothetical protein